MLRLLTIGSLAAFPLTAQQREMPPGFRNERAIPKAPDRKAGDGEGPFPRLVIRGATLVDGTGGPPVGPVDVVVERNRITQVAMVGFPGLKIDSAGRPARGTKEIDATGMYVLPGFVDTHAHMGGIEQGTPAEYVFKLWLGHGITTIRDPGCLNGADWCLNARARSASNAIAAPRIFAYTFAMPGVGYTEPLNTPDDAKRFVAWVAQKGLDGIKIDLNPEPDVLATIIAEANKAQLGTAAHLSQQMVARFNAIKAARTGLTTLEHWYGLPESLFEERTVQNYPLDYNYQDESHRFGQAGRLWKQAAAPGSVKWKAMLDEFLRLDFTFSPTLTIYEASRDAMRARTAEWHEVYTLPSLWRFYQPSRAAHGSYWFDWTTEDEIAWKENYRTWMRFLQEYKNLGGRVCTGSDAGFIYKLYGFDYIRELELLQEAGFHPLEVIRSATLCGAEAIMKPKGQQPEFGSVRPGKLADLVLVEGNPVRNLKLLYGTGHVKLDDATGQPTRAGGVRYTIKDGIVYDAKELLADVRRIVADAKRKDTTRVQTSAQE